MSGTLIVSRTEFKSDERICYDHTNHVICVIERFRSWESGKGVNGKLLTHVYGWAKDAELLVRNGFPVELVGELQPAEGYHFNGNSKGDIPFKWLEDRR